MGRHQKHLPQAKNEAQSPASSSWEEKPPRVSAFSLLLCTKQNIHLAIMITEEDSSVVPHVCVKTPYLVRLQLRDSTKTQQVPPRKRRNKSRVVLRRSTGGYTDSRTRSPGVQIPSPLLSNHVWSWASS